MKRLNNEGFAISAIIYGISILGIMIVAILLGVMATNRSNTTQLVDKIEEELNTFDRTSNTFSPLEDDNLYIRYIVPVSGWYKIELWGAKGVGNGSFGSYTSGIIKMEKGDTVFFGIKRAAVAGEEAKKINTEMQFKAAESGETMPDVIMRAAGGGASDNVVGGTIYNNDANAKSTGGQVKIGVNDSFEVESGSLIGLDPYTATTGGSAKSKIRGYAGSVEEGTPNFPNAFFYNGNMIPGVNDGDGKAKIEMIAGDSSTIERKNTKLNGIRYVRDCISNEYDDDEFVRVIAVKDGEPIEVTTGTSETKSGQKCKKFDLGEAKDWDEIATWHKTMGQDYKMHTIEVSVNGSSGWKYLKKGKYDISDTETAVGTHVSAYRNDSTGTVVEEGNYYLMPVLFENKVMSAPVALVDETSIDPNNLSQVMQNAIDTELLNGDNRQKWSIEKIEGTSEYRILELFRYNSLRIDHDQNLLNNTLSAKFPFNSFNNDSSIKNEPERWTITSVGDGTYEISTVVEPPAYTGLSLSGSGASGSGHLIAATDPTHTELYHGGNPAVVIGKNTKAARFKLIPLNW